MIDWILVLLQLVPEDPKKAAEGFNRASSEVGERLRPWLYGLIGGVVVLLVVCALLVLTN